MNKRMTTLAKLTSQVRPITGFGVADEGNESTDSDGPRQGLFSHSLRTAVCVSLLGPWSAVNPLSWRQNDLTRRNEASVLNDVPQKPPQTRSAMETASLHGEKQISHWEPVAKRVAGT